MDVFTYHRAYILIYIDAASIKNQKQKASKGSHVQYTETSVTDILMSNKWIMHLYLIMHYQDILIFLSV